MFDIICLLAFLIILILGLLFLAGLKVLAFKMRIIFVIAAIAVFLFVVLSIMGVI